MENNSETKSVLVDTLKEFRLLGFDVEIFEGVGKMNLGALLLMSPDRSSVYKSLARTAPS